MKKIIVSMIVICLLLTSSIASANAFEKVGLPKQSEELPRQSQPINVKPYGDIYVDDDNTHGPWDGTYEHPYQHIQDGIDAASDGDTIFVYSGTYDNKWILIPKSIKLVGEDRDSTIITGYVSISADNVTVRRFTLETIMIVEKVSNCTISGNKFANIKGVYYAIRAEEATYCDIIGNLLTNLSGDDYIRAITVGSHCNVIGNTVTNLSGDDYIRVITVGSHCNVIGNTVTNLSGENYVNAVVADSDCNVIGNTVTNLSGGRYVMAITVGSHCNVIGNTVTNICGDSYINAIIVGSHCNVIGNTITDLNGLHATGIHESSYSNIAENIITNLNGDLGCGISINVGSTIVENDISDIIGDMAFGIYICGESYEPNKEHTTTITGNTVSNCGYSCIYLGLIHYVTIKENTLIGKWPTDYNFGICLGGFVTQTTISENTIMSNSRGIYLSVGCKKNIVSKNTITNNGEGIGMGRGQNIIGYASNNKIIGNNITDTTGYGIYCEKGSRSNHIYYNNFINNGNFGETGGNAYDVGYFNIWYKFKPFGVSMGNYWDDYIGVDENPKDGIGDMPYTIPGKIIPSKDWYPVMEPFDIENIELTMKEYKTQEPLNNQNSQNTNSPQQGTKSLSSTLISPTNNQKSFSLPDNWKLFVDDRYSSP